MSQWQEIYTTNTLTSGAARLAVNKFGYNPTVGGSYESVWDGANVYVYIDTPGTATVTSDDTTADDGGTVEVIGLDSNYLFASETLTIGGAAGTQTFARVYRARMVSANTGNSNVGTVTVTVDSKASALIRPTYGQTLMCVYTTPANYRGFLTQIDLGSQKDQEHQVRFVTREIDNGNAWNTKAFITLRGGFLEKGFHAPLLIPPKSDIEIQALAGATSALSASFEMYLQRI